MLASLITQNFAILSFQVWKTDRPKSGKGHSDMLCFVWPERIGFVQLEGGEQCAQVVGANYVRLCQEQPMAGRQFPARHSVQQRHFDWPECSVTRDAFHGK